jgi:hypothetical protein
MQVDGALAHVDLHRAICFLSFGLLPGKNSSCQCGFRRIAEPGGFGAYRYGSSETELGLSKDRTRYRQPH